jgi:exopolysaccharide production protein ExoQ
MTTPLPEKGAGTAFRAASLPLLFFFVVSGSLFFLDHDLSASLRFQEMMEAESVDDLDAASAMFQPTPVRQVAGLALGAFGLLFLMLVSRRGEWPSGVLPALLVFFVAWNFMSVAWAMDPSMTGRRLVLFGALALGALAAARRFTVEDIMTLGIVAPGLFLMIGVGSEFYNGTFQPGSAEFRFAGTMHPNEQALNCAILLLAALSYVRASQHWKVFILIAGVAFVFLVLTKSRTALASTVVVIAAHYILSLSGPRKMAAYTGVVAGFAFFFLLMELFLPLFLQSINLGRADAADSVGSLTGRVPLWIQSLGFAAQRPLLGYGHGGFWNVDNTSIIMQEQGWPLSHAHNAYLDILLELGPIGLITFVLILFIGVRRAYQAHDATGAHGYAYMGILLMFFALNGWLESNIVQRTQGTFLAMLVLIHLALTPAPAEATASSAAPSRGPAPRPDRQPAGALRDARS